MLIIRHVLTLQCQGLQLCACYFNDLKYCFFNELINTVTQTCKFIVHIKSAFHLLSGTAGIGYNLVASGIIDLTVNPPVTLPSTIGGFNIQGVIDSWTVAGNCERFAFDCSPFLPITPGAAGSTILATVSTCDDCTQNVTLPFAFPWLGYYPVTKVSVTSNGAVNIDQNNNPSLSNDVAATPISTASQSIPSGISVAHEDLNPAASASAVVLTSYNEAQGAFTISYQNVPFWNTGGYMNAQVVLYRDGTVELTWGAVAGGGECTFG